MFTRALDESSPVVETMAGEVSDIVWLVAITAVVVEVEMDEVIAKVSEKGLAGVADEDDPELCSVGCVLFAATSGL